MILEEEKIKFKIALVVSKSLYQYYHGSSIYDTEQDVTNSPTM
jgi:hypothetical protein